MNLQSRAFRPAAIAAGIVTPVVLLLGMSAAQTKKPQKPPMAGQKYKNIKVLKDLPADQVIPIMHKINDSLGVKCDFCHIVETNAAGQHVGWEKDDKPMKTVARKMIVMTQELDKKQPIVKGKVTCFTCHHGRAEPEGAPPAAK
jgi:hypothetical protein